MANPVEPQRPTGQQEVVYVRVPMGANAKARLDAFAQEAGVDTGDVCRFAIAQLLAWQDGIAMLLMQGERRGARPDGG